MLEAAPRVIAYYPNWAIYHPNPLYIYDIPYLLLDDVIYAFFTMDEEGRIQSDDPDLDFGPKGLEGLQVLKKQSLEQGHPLRIFLSIGGEKGPIPFAKMAASAEMRTRFAADALSLCAQYDLDGIDLDWEFPKNKKKGRDLLLLVKELYQGFQNAPRPLKITLAAPGHPHYFKQIPWQKLSAFVDRLHVMTYNFHGPWKNTENTVTNHQCALKPPSIGSPELCITAAMDFYLRYFPKEKLTVGIPLFFNAYADAKEGNPPSHYGSPYSGPAPHLEDSERDGVLLYHEVQTELEKKILEGFWDEHAKAFSVYDSKTALFGSGISEKSIEAIASFTLEKKFYGVMIWSLSGDTSDWKALKQIHASFFQK